MVSRAYELMLVVSPECDEEAVAKVVERVSAIVEDHGGSVDKVNKWGKRRLE